MQWGGQDVILFRNRLDETKVLRGTEMKQESRTYEGLDRCFQIEEQRENERSGCVPFQALGDNSGTSR